MVAIGVLSGQFVSVTGDAMTGDLVLTDGADLHAEDDVFVGDDEVISGDLSVAGVISGPTIDDLEADIADAEAEIAALESQITMINAQIVDLQNADVALDVRLDFIEPTVAALVAVVDLHTTAISTIQGQITTIQGQITALQSAQTTTQADLDTLEANAVLLNPTSGGTYVGNTFTPPPNPAATVPWLRSAVIPYSAGDTNFDVLRIRVIDEFGNTVNAQVWNGNGEGRDRPSARNRVARRTYESTEAVGGSTDQYVQWSSDAAVREPFFGGWGSASPKPGWAEGTRVVSGLQGVSMGGTVNAALAPYNTLTGLIFRGFKAGLGPPAAGTWLLNDVVIDSGGAAWRCTVAGTPGTWTGGSSDFTTITNLNAGLTLGSTPMATSLIENGRAVRMRGFLTVGGVAIPANTVLCRIGAAGHIPVHQVRTGIRYSGGGNRVQITTTGDVSIAVILNPGDDVWADSLTYDLRT